MCAERDASRSLWAARAMSYSGHDEKLLGIPRSSLVTLFMHMAFSCVCFWERRFCFSSPYPYHYFYFCFLLCRVFFSFPFFCMHIIIIIIILLPHLPFSSFSFLFPFTSLSLVKRIYCCCGYLQRHSQAKMRRSFKSDRKNGTC